MPAPPPPTVQNPSPAGMFNNNTMQTLRGPVAAGPGVGNQALPIAYDEKADYKETYDGKTLSATRLLMVDWDYRRPLIKSMLATASVGPVIDGDKISLGPWLGAGQQSQPFQRLALNRLLPEPHPTLPFLFAMEAEVVEGVGAPYQQFPGGPLEFVHNAPLGPNSQPTTGKALVRVVYRWLPYRVDISDASTNQVGASEIGRYVGRQYKPAGSNLPIQGTIFKEVDNANIIPEAIPKIFPKMKMTYTWYMVPMIPAGLYALMALCNQGPFDAGGYISNLGTGTSLYLQPDISEPYPTAHGDTVWDISLDILFRSPGHNYLWRPARGVFVQIIRSMLSTIGGVKTVVNPPDFQPGNPEPNSAGENLYDYGELHNLFKLTGNPG